MQDFNFQEFHEPFKTSQQYLDFYAVPTLESDRIPSSESLSPKYLINLSTRTDIKDKPAKKSAECSKLGDGWQKSSFTLEDLRDHVQAGYSFNTCQLKDSVRLDINFESASAVFVDIDNKKNNQYSHELTIEEALKLPFIQDHCSMIYTSASHTDDWNRFRVVFLLPSPCSDPVAYKQTILDVCSNIKGADSTTSISQIFYGNSKADFPLFNPCARLDLETLPRKIAISDKTDISAALPSEICLEGLGQVVELETLTEGDKRLLIELQNLKEPVDIALLLTKAHKQFLSIAQKGIDRSGLMRTFYYDAHGAANFCKSHNIPYKGIPSELINRAADVNEMDARKLSAVLEDVKPARMAISPKVFKQGSLGFLYDIAVASGIRKVGQKYNRFTKEKWENYRSFTPDKIIHEEFLTHIDSSGVTTWNLLNELIDSFDLIFIRSGLGTGKTQAFAQFLIDKFGALLIGYRNALLLQICEKINKLKGDLGKIHHLQKDDAKNMVSDTKKLMALCLDSLHHFSDNHFDDQIVIIDEAVSVMLHLMTSTTLAKFMRQNDADVDGFFKGRAIYLAKFNQAIARASKVIVLDGHLNDATCKYLEDLRAKGGKASASIKVLNTFQPTKQNVKIIEAMNESGKICAYNSSPLPRHLLSALQSRLPGQSIPIISDSKAMLKNLHTKLTDMGYNCLLVCSDTVGEGRELQYPLQHEFCKEAEDFINKHPEIDVILMSPTVESGIDIPNKNRFLCGFAFFNGLLSTNTNLQFMRRVRDCRNWFVHIVPKCNLYDKRSLNDWHEAGLQYINQTLPEDSIKAVREKMMADAGMMKNSVSWNYHDELLDSLLFERDNSKECLIYALKEAGHDVEIVQLPSDEMLSDELKGIKNDRYMELSDQTCAADRIPFDEAQSLMQKIDRSEDEQMQIDRSLLVRDLGGDEECSLINKEFVFSWLKDRKGGELLTMKRRVRLKRSQEWKTMNQKDLMEKVSIDDLDNEKSDLHFVDHTSKVLRFCPQDLPLEDIKLSALVDLNVADLLVDNGWHDAGSPKLLKIVKTIADNPTLLGLFGRGFASEDSKQWLKALNTLLQEFGFRIENQRIRANDRKPQYRYSLSEPTEEEKDATRDKAEDADRLAVTEAQWLQSEQLEACVNKAMDNRLEELKEKGMNISDPNFDINSLILDGIPHHSEMELTEGEREAIESMHEEFLKAKGALKLDKAKEVKQLLQALWAERKPDEVILVSKTEIIVRAAVERKSFEVAKELTSPLAEILEDDELNF